MSALHEPSINVPEGGCSSWIDFYHALDKHSTLMSESELTNKDISLSNLSLKNSDLFSDNYPVEAVSNIYLQNNDFSELSILAAIATADGEVNVSGNPVTDLSPLNYLNLTDGDPNSYLTINDPLSYDVLLNKDDLLCQDLIQGKIAGLKISKGSSITVGDPLPICEDKSVANIWIAFYNNIANKTVFTDYNNNGFKATLDSQLMGRRLEWEKNSIDDESIPRGLYPSQSISGFKIKNAEVTHLDSLYSVKKYDGRATYINEISLNPSLVNIKGLSNITEGSMVASSGTSYNAISLYIKNNLALETLSGLPRARQIVGRGPLSNILITDNPILEHIPESFYSGTVYGKVHDFRNNPSLTDFSFLSNFHYYSPTNIKATIFLDKSNFITKFPVGSSNFCRMISTGKASVNGTTGFTKMTEFCELETWANVFYMAKIKTKGGSSYTEYAQTDSDVFGSSLSLNFSGNFAQFIPMNMSEDDKFDLSSRANKKQLILNNTDLESAEIFKGNLTVPNQWREASEYIKVTSNKNLRTLSGLEGKLTPNYNYISNKGSVRISHNPLLTDISQLPRIAENRNVEILDNGLLESIPLFEGCIKS